MSKFSTTRKKAATVFEQSPGAPRSAAETPASPVTARKPQPAIDPANLTEAQQALELRLRDWRKAEAEKMGMPQFFVLGTTALRSIVVEHPRTLPQLSVIEGIGKEKLDRFGASILEVCNTL